MSFGPRTTGGSNPNKVQPNGKKNWEIQAEMNQAKQTAADEAARPGNEAQALAKAADAERKVSRGAAANLLTGGRGLLDEDATTARKTLLGY